MNKRPKVCLFTAHSPTGGGGGAVLRSLVLHLSAELDIDWRYLAPFRDDALPAGWLGKPLMGSGNPLHDIVETAGILVGSRVKRWAEIVGSLRSADCEAYWIVSHNEGLGVARDLAKLSGRPVHLTVHDDWAGALCARSRRYHLFSALADRLSGKVLRSVRSVDVISQGMREYYVKKFGVDTNVVHRCIARIPVADHGRSKDQLRVGHLGSLYSKDDFIVFLKVLRSLARKECLHAKVVLWGPNLKSSDIPSSLSEFVEFRPTTDENAVIADLQSCQFAYAAYPFTRRLQCFARTSLPTKISTYVAAQCPILGHAPSDSTLATFLRQTKVGVAWHDLAPDHGVNAIKSVLALRPPEHAWDDAVSTFFGPANVETMRKLLFQAVRHSPK